MKIHFCLLRRERSFRCPAVQEVLKLSNYTKHIDGYPGMINTMKALEESNLERWPNEKFSTLFNTSNINSETGYIHGYEEFLCWYGTSSSFIPFFLWACMFLSIWIVLGSVFLLFGLHFQSDDPNEIMFPVLLEIKEPSHNKRRRAGVRDLLNESKSEHEVELGNKKIIRSQAFHFVRPKRFVLQATVWVSLGLIVFVLGPSFGTLDFQSRGSAYYDTFYFQLWISISCGPLASVTLTGLLIQIHNATTLANILVQLMSKKNLSPEQRQAQFEQWKEYYKTTVGALHIWSKRISPMSSSLILFFVVMSAFFFFLLINFF